MTIPAGQTSVTIPVTINGDATFEGDESFTLSLTDIANAAVGGTAAGGGGGAERAVAVVEQAGGVGNGHRLSPSVLVGSGVSRSTRTDRPASSPCAGPAQPDSGLVFSGTASSPSASSSPPVHR